MDPSKAKFFSFALEIEHHRKKLGMHAADPKKLEIQFGEYLDKKNQKKEKS